MSISHCYCSDYMTKPTQFGDEPNICQIEHTRHRSVDNFATNLFAGLIAYNLLPKKPSVNIEIIDKSKLIA